MAKFKMKSGKGKVVEMKAIHDIISFRLNPEWVEVIEEEPAKEVLEETVVKKTKTKKTVEV